MNRLNDRETKQMIRRSQYRCSFKEGSDKEGIEAAVSACRERVSGLIKEGRVCNLSFYRYLNMGFLYIEEITADADAPFLNVEKTLKEFTPFLKPWPREEGDVFFAPMVNVYYHHIPDSDIDEWEKERTVGKKTRIGRIAFLFPDKLPSYVMYHTAIVQEGLLKGDKYQYISLHENILFSYYEEPRNNVNIKGSDQESEVIKDWLSVDPESHFDRVKAKGENFLVIPCVFSIDRIDMFDR